MGDGRIILLWQTEHREAVGKWFEIQQSKQRERKRPQPASKHTYLCCANTLDGDKALACDNKAIEATFDLNTGTKTRLETRAVICGSNPPRV